MQLLRRMWPKAKSRWRKRTRAKGSTKLQLKTLDRVQKKQPPKGWGLGAGLGGEQKHKDSLAECKLGGSNNQQQAEACFPVFPPGIE